MTNDKQVEAWRNEHKVLLLATNNWCLANFQEVDGSYFDWHLQASWEGFLMAKRSMQPIELPRTNWNPVVMGHFYSHGEVVKAITAAGYSYRVKE